jgi:hypothetical protein
MTWWAGTMGGMDIRNHLAQFGGNMGAGEPSRTTPNHGLKNRYRLVFTKIGETSPDRFHRFSINWSVNLNFLKILIFFEKMVYRFRYRFTDFGGFQPWLADRFTSFGTGLPVIPIGKPIIPTGLLILDF